MRWKTLLLHLLLSLGTGGLAALCTMHAMPQYTQLRHPPLAPPGIVFPIVWSLLFLLMGISAFLIHTSESALRRTALTLYGVQLAVNFVWPLLFFLTRLFLLSALWLLLLWGLVVAMLLCFARVRPTAAWLQLPYLVWITFAGYLNFGIWLLNP